jgi:hypothetical protein
VVIKFTRYSKCSYLTIFDLTGARPFNLPRKLGPFCLAFLTWAPFNLNEPAPDLLVCASFLPAWVALICRFLRILADRCGSVFMKQVDGLATILPFLGPDEHLKPCLGALPLVRLRIWLTPSAMAEWSGCDSISPFTITGTMSCGTGSCVWPSAMALDLVALDLVSSCLVGARITSVIFISVFIDLTVLNLNADMLNLTPMLKLMLKLML